ncbi:MAG TPA: universal stress protein [Burkholderiaceae bacterium]|jgi:nucleotide-binding universal stress UspA family protein|nr:universal stress protein [Burkholderiaceae bacterium]
MTYRTILYSIEEDPAAESHIDYAANLARFCEGRLVGVGCHRPSPYPSDGAVAFVAGDPLTIELREAEEAALARESVFLQRCHLAGLATAEAIRDNSTPTFAVVANALFADLVVMPQPSPDLQAYGEHRGRAEAILQQSPRPVLMLPYAGRFESQTGPVLVAWDGSAGAGRAASAALPLLRRASAVHLVQVFDPGKEDATMLEPDLKRAATWLGGHGVKVKTELLANSLPVGQALLSEGADRGVQLFVMGAWGRSRLVERVLGGATRTMVESMTAPVLFTH